MSLCTVYLRRGSFINNHIAKYIVITIFNNLNMTNEKIAVNIETSTKKKDSRFNFSILDHIIHNRKIVLSLIILASIAGITFTMMRLNNIRENSKRCYCYRGTPVESEKCTTHLNEECGSCDWGGLWF